MRDMSDMIDREGGPPLLSSPPPTPSLHHFGGKEANFLGASAIAKRAGRLALTPSHYLLFSLRLSPPLAEAKYLPLERERGGKRWDTIGC